MKLIKKKISQKKLLLNLSGFTYHYAHICNIHKTIMSWFQESWIPFD